MLIEFRLPPERGGFLPGHARDWISEELSLWAQRHNITYKEKTFKLIHRVCFDDDQHYVFFRLTWNPSFNDLWWHDYKIITDRERNLP